MINHVLSSVRANPQLQDLDSLVAKVLASLTKDAKAFAYASSLYNSDFFATEHPETKTRLCAVLADFFGPEFQNAYWNTNRTGVPA